MAWEAGFFDTEGHRPTLLRLAAAFLVDQDPQLAFFCADRRIRTGRTPRARDLLLRAASLRQLGHSAAALHDVQSARQDDGADLTLLRHRLTAGPEAGDRIDAARLILDHPAANSSETAAALACLGQHGEDLVLAVARSGPLLSGWVAWRGEDAPVLRWAGRTHDLEPSGIADAPASGFRAAAFAWPVDRDTTVAVEARIGDRRTRRIVVPADAAPDRHGPHRTTPAQTGRTLTIIVAAYRDRAATAECLASVAAQRTDFPVRLIVVDDHSPEPALSGVLKRFCADHGATLIVNEDNLGFTRSVNRALGVCGAGDVLLLNSDVVLGEDTLQRLRAVAETADDIGTIAPLSNDSSVTSFPRPDAPNPFLAEPERHAIDAAARAANGASSCDVLANIGFCLYVAQPCRRDVGCLNPIYGLGYYEDIEFCLKAGQRGYRNVAATGIYVGHRSGRSFQATKSPLASRNGALLWQRFMAYPRDFSAAAAADPLRQARGAIEERLPPPGPIHLLIGRPALLGPLLQRQADAVSGTGRLVLQLSWSGRGDALAADLQALDGSAPRSLSFRLDEPGMARLGTYLSKLDLSVIEFAELRALPEALRHRILTIDASRSILVGSRAMAREACEWAQGDRPGATTVAAADAMAQAVLRRGARHGSGPDAPRRRAAGPLHRIGFVVPVAQPSVERLIATLARHLLDRRTTRLIVLGGAVDDLQLMTTGNVLVSGPVAPPDYAALFDHYAVDALFSPYRTSGFGLFDAVSARTTRPRGYFDWSGGGFVPRADDFVLDPSLPDEAVCEHVAQWCGPARAETDTVERV